MLGRDLETEIAYSVKRELEESPDFALKVCISEHPGHPDPAVPAWPPP